MHNVQLTALPEASGSGLYVKTAGEVAADTGVFLTGQPIKDSLLLRADGSCHGGAAWKRKKLFEWV